MGPISQLYNTDDTFLVNTEYFSKIGVRNSTENTFLTALFGVATKLVDPTNNSYLEFIQFSLMVLVAQKCRSVSQLVVRILHGSSPIEIINAINGTSTRPMKCPHPPRSVSAKCFKHENRNSLRCPSAIIVHKTDKPMSEHSYSLCKLIWDWVFSVKARLATDRPYRAVNTCKISRKPWNGFQSFGYHLSVV